MQERTLGVVLLRALVFSAFLAGCGSSPQNTESVHHLAQALPSDARGSLPEGLPNRFMLGLDQQPGGTDWIAGSGVPWDARYQYLSKGWVDNWGYGNKDGKFVLDYLEESKDLGILPAVEFYQIVEEPGGGEDQMLAKAQTPSTMKSYFSDFKILMERVKDFGSPVLVMVEADGFGFLQIQSGSNPDAYAAVADSGLPELAGVPNTVAGWGLAFLALREAVGAKNAVMGMHVSGWATNADMMQNFDFVDLPSEVDEVAAFVKPLGLAENQTGKTYDFLVGDPSDRDADWYRLVRNQEKWWDSSDDAGIDTRSFNRYAEWLRLWNEKTDKRWVLWQIPIGNANHLNVVNEGAPRQGYKDNRAEYFLGDEGDHIRKFAASGVVALLFGPGMVGLSSYRNDNYFDGEPFIRTRAAHFYDEVPLAFGSEHSNPKPPPTTSASAGAGTGGLDVTPPGGGGAGGAASGGAGVTAPVTGGTGAVRNPDAPLDDRASGCSVAISSGSNNPWGAFLVLGSVLAGLLIRARSSKISAKPRIGTRQRICSAPTRMS